MGFEPTTLRDLVGSSNHWPTRDFMVSKGQFMGLNWNRIKRLHSHRLYIKMQPTNLQSEYIKDETTNTW